MQPTGTVRCRYFPCNTLRIAGYRCPRNLLFYFLERDAIVATEETSRPPRQRRTQQYKGGIVARAEQEPLQASGAATTTDRHSQEAGIISPWRRFAVSLAGRVTRAVDPHLLPLLAIYVGVVLLALRQSNVDGFLVPDEEGYTGFVQKLSQGFYSPRDNINLWRGPVYPIMLIPFVLLHLSWAAAQLLIAALPSWPSA